MRFLLSAVSIFFLSLLTALPSYSDTPRELVFQAQKQVAEYRALRQICIVAKFQEKQRCFSELNGLTEQYKSAKATLAAFDMDTSSLSLGYNQ